MKDTSLIALYHGIQKFSLSTYFRLREIGLQRGNFITLRR